MVSYHIVPINDITEVSVDGTLDLESSRHLVREIARASEASGKNVLIDIRGVRAKLSYPDVYRVVLCVAEHPAAFSGRVAVLDDYNDEFVKSQFFEASATVLGFSVRAFLDEDQAASWLEKER